MSGLEADEDNSVPRQPACDICGCHLRRYEARQVPTFAVDGGFETSVICAGEECSRVCHDVYRQSMKRHRWGWDEPALHRMAVEMERER